MMTSEPMSDWLVALAAVSSGLVRAQVPQVPGHAWRSSDEALVRAVIQGAYYLAPSVQVDDGPVHEAEDGARLERTTFAVVSLDDGDVSGYLRVSEEARQAGFDSELGTVFVSDWGPDVQVRVPRERHRTLGDFIGAAELTDDRYAAWLELMTKEVAQ